MLWLTVAFHRTFGVRLEHETSSSHQALFNTYYTKTAQYCSKLEIGRLSYLNLREFYNSEVRAVSFYLMSL